MIWEWVAWFYRYDPTRVGFWASHFWGGVESSCTRISVNALEFYQAFGYCVFGS